MKPLIVGEAPSKNEVTERPIEGRVGKRLASLCGLTYEEFLERFERVNLLHVRQDTKEKGFEFDHVAACNAAHDLWLKGAIAKGRVVILLGWRVARAFSEQTGYFEGRETINGARIYVVPHPSGVNRWWNQDDHKRMASEFFQKISDDSVELVGNGKEPIGA